MKYNYLIDTHNHTSDSMDADFSAAEMCEGAVKNGLDIIALTDHVELDVFKRDGFDLDAEASYKHINKVKDEFAGRIKVLTGVELGEASYAPEDADRLLSEKDYDFVLGSIHNLRNREDFYFIDYSKVSTEAIILEYYNEIKNLIHWGGFDSLAHLTYPLRYIVGEHGFYVDESKFKGQVDEILTLLAEKDKALEINTSGLRQKLGRTMPDEDVIRRFRELGGRLITVGSDAHRPGDIGAGIIQSYEIAKRCGFGSIFYFENRKPVEIGI